MTLKRKGEIKVAAFLWVLAAAILVFILGGWLAGISIEDSSSSSGKSSQYIFFEDFGRIGQSEATFSDYAYGDFTVGITNGERTVQEINNIYISKGFVSDNSHLIKFNSNNPQNGHLLFKVLNTNLYGNLRVIVNGKLIFNSKILPSATQEVELSNLVSGENTILVTAESSGLRFWAPTIYELQSLSLRVNDFGEKSFSKEFRIRDYELNGFDRAELSFFINRATRDEPLFIKINGNSIYNDNPIRRISPYTIPFTARETNLVSGENTIDIYTGQNAEYELENILLKIFYFGSANKTVLFREFNLKSSDFSRLSQRAYQGQIEFDATVISRGNMKIFLNNNAFDVFPKNGINRIFFDQKTAKRGPNTLQIETDSTMDLNNFSISIARKR